MKLDDLEKSFQEEQSDKDRVSEFLSFVVGSIEKISYINEVNSFTEKFLRLTILVLLSFI